MKMLKMTQNMNKANWDKTSGKSSISNILAKIILHTPIPLNHIHFVVMDKSTSNIPEKKSLIVSPRSPIWLTPKPNSKQNTTRPIVFGPDRYVNWRSIMASDAFIDFDSTKMVWACWKVAWNTFSGKIFLKKYKFTFNFEEGWVPITMNSYLPKSRRLSRNFPSFLFSNWAGIWLGSAVPGLNVIAMVNPMRMESIVVKIKYISARNTILPLTPACRLDDTVIIDDISNGKVINFNIRKNNSPGYDISKIVSFDKCCGRKLIPAWILLIWIIIIWEILSYNQIIITNLKQWQLRHRVMWLSITNSSLSYPQIYCDIFVLISIWTKMRSLDFFVSFRCQPLFFNVNGIALLNEIQLNYFLN